MGPKSNQTREDDPAAIPYRLQGTFPLEFQNRAEENHSLRMSKNGKYLALLTGIFQEAEYEVLVLGLKRASQPNEGLPYERAREPHSTLRGENLVVWKIRRAVRHASGAPRTSKYKALFQGSIVLSSSERIMSTSSDLPLLRPIPRRPRTIETASPSPSPNATPSPLLSSPDNLASPADSLSPTEFRPPKRTKSAIALTSSTLFGIYSLSNDANKDTEPSTPFLSRNSSVLDMADLDIKKVTPSHVPVKHTRKEPVPWYKVALRGMALFAFGVAYGAVVTDLHNSKKFSPSTVDIDRYNPRYLVQWGLAGVVLGSLLPWLDGKDTGNGSIGAKIDWDPAVRSIGAFVGIAYAIRKLPWQSTLQVSVSLSLVNPFLWYLIDRTRVGFWLSAAVGITGTAFLLQTNPEMIQTPETISFPDESKIAGSVSVESFGVTVWIASVLFCSCVCFGNVGRRFASMERNG
ncbi:insulin-induced protein-domain-containing protein [Tuber indicum]|nr:insulin-induced protein-domain-containing protein [Tuber indicum]